MSLPRIQPFMFQAHPAYRAQIEVLRIGEKGKFYILPTLPNDKIEHERWRTSGGVLGKVVRRFKFLERRSMWSASKGSNIYIAGSLPPSMYRLLDQVDRAHIDADDPLSLFIGGTRNHLPGEAFRIWAQSLCKRLGRVSLSFWSRIQMTTFLGNLYFSETHDLIESGLISVIPPALFPRVQQSPARTDNTLHCLCVASGKFWHKGIPDAIVALDRLAQEGLAITLTLVGADIPSEWRALISSRPYLHLYEKVKRSQLDALFLKHDLLIFPSHHDTYGWVLMEAKTFGMPALVTDSYSRPEIITHGQDGLLVRDPFSNAFLPTSPIAYAASHIDIDKNDHLRVSPLLEPYIIELTGALRRLAEDTILLRNLGAGALASVQPNAHFGATTRAKHLAQYLNYE